MRRWVREVPEDAHTHFLAGLATVLVTVTLFSGTYHYLATVATLGDSIVPLPEAPAVEIPPETLVTIKVRRDPATRRPIFEINGEVYPDLKSCHGPIDRMSSGSGSRTRVEVRCARDVPFREITDLVRQLGQAPPWRLSFSVTDERVEASPP